MHSNINSGTKIEVSMLGEFSITINGNQLTNLKGRTKRVWMLIEYLLANRKNDVSLEKLVDVLWEEGECGDPLNALKNLIYRARTVLKDLSKDETAEFIKFERNTYAWNNNFDCVIDTEQLVEFRNRAADRSKPDEERIDFYKKALALYRGEFLPKSSYSTWVISAAVHYATLHTDCVLKLCSLLMDHQRFEEIIQICESALVFAPMEESIHKLLLCAYISTGQRNKALTHYNSVIDLFYKELGVDISDSMRPVYKQLINSINHIEIDLSVIKSDLTEAYTAGGAYYCDYDVFKSIYRIQARTILRTGQSIFIVLFTLTDLNGEIPDPEVTKVAVGRLKDAILTSLRKGDAFASYSATQFIVMLPFINYENAEIVSNRILQRFRFEYRKNNVQVSTRINSVDSVE